MKIGIPRETLRHEHRIGLTPFGISRLKSVGCEVFVEHDAGRDCHFTDRDFTQVGASIVYGKDEIFGRADLVCKVGRVTHDEAAMMGPGTAVTGFMHIAMMAKETIRTLVERGITVLGWEAVEDLSGAHPVRRSMSEIAGQMAIQWAAHLLQYEQGGRGIVLGNAPGIAPATVLILGAGAVGWSAARSALAQNAHVIVMDADLSKLRRAMEHGCDHAVTSVASQRNLTRFLQIADVVVGAVASPRGRTPFLVSEEMVRQMKPGAVILDLSIDEGGCVETSRPTTLDKPTFKVHEVTHFCVPTMTANAPRTASRALTLASVPFLISIAELGLEAALRADSGLARGVYIHNGHVMNALAAQALGMSVTNIGELLAS